MPKAVLTEYGKNKIILHKDIPEGVLMEIVGGLQKCDCGYEELDPDSYHKSGCSSLYITVRLPDGTEVLERKTAFKII